VPLRSGKREHARCESGPHWRARPGAGPAARFKHTGRPALAGAPAGWGRGCPSAERGLPAQAGPGCRFDPGPPIPHAPPPEHVALAANAIDASSSESLTATPADRCVSFVGLECDAKARQMIALVRRDIDQPARTNAFWEYFKKKATAGSGPPPDDLFLVHSHLDQMRELFELHEDERALDLLDRIERECC
jgi:hypothetical protein